MTAAQTKMTILISIFTILMTSDSQSICDTDISPNSDTCLQLHTWQFCTELWMIDQCCVTCGYISCLDTCYDGDIHNVPPDRLTPYNCSSDIPPNNETCQEIASWGSCAENWVYGHCCASCPGACRCNTSNNTIAPITTPSLCNSDISPNEVDTCLDFYTWGDCSAIWMVDKCCTTCGYSSCLDSCYDGDINNVPPDRLTPFDCNSDLSPNSVNTCSDFKQWGDCSAEWMQNKGQCCKSCPAACHCPSNASEPSTVTSTVSIVHHVDCEQDMAPPAGSDGVQSSCLAQYRWDNCNAAWMGGYCCLTCGFQSCLNVCYDGDADNIAYSEYYPNPFDCRINEQPPPADATDGMSAQPTCQQQAGDGNCDEWWMYGYCCNVCPEACLCDEFNWNNNTFSEDSNEFGYGKLSYAEIKFWERLFIAMHCLLLFAILMIPLVIYGQKCYAKATDAIRVNIERIYTETVDSPSPAQEKQFGDHLGTVGLTVSPQTHCHVVTDDEEQRTPTPEIECKSSVRSSDKSKRSDGDTQEEGSKGLEYFKLLAFVCVSLWILRILLEITSMSIWYIDTEFATAIARPWDAFRMSVYIIPKTLMYLTFILRIYFCFKDCAYAYSKKFIIGLVVVLLMDVIVRITVHIMVIYTFSGDIIDRNGSDLYRNGIFYGLVFLVIEEIIFTLVVVIAFVKPLFVISKSVLTENIVDMMSKYVVLGYWCIISSFTISIFGIFYISTNDLFIIWTRTLLLSLDCVINSWCTVLVFQNAVFWYNKICPLCHKCIKLVYITKFKSQGIELTKYG